VEVTGTSLDTVLNALMMVTVSLAERGGRIYSSIIDYPYGNARRTVTPVLRTRRARVPLHYIREVLGLDFSASEAIRLLRRARFDASRVTPHSLEVVVPCFRLDVMHPVDIVEDIGIAYGLNKIEPRWPPQMTVGGITERHEFSDLLRELLIGLGYQEVLTFTLSNPEKLFTRMNLPPDLLIELKNPRVQTLTCLRNWLIPSLVEVLSLNVHVSYPQRVFEAGECIMRNASKVDEVLKLAAVTCHAEASFTEARAAVDSLLRNLGLQCEVVERDHGSFLEGRVGSIMIREVQAGILGEIHPQVLENWGIQNPAAAFELDAGVLLGAASNH